MPLPEGSQNLAVVTNYEGRLLKLGTSIVRALRFAGLLSVGLVTATQTPPILTQYYDFEDASTRVSLRHRVDEASGLAVTGDGRVFTHGDERAVVYEVDPVSGEEGRGLTLL